MGPRRDRLSGFRGYGGRDRVSTPMFILQKDIESNFYSKYGFQDRDAGPRRQFGPRSAADGIWTHDKYVELEREEG
ncbi:hypothetical protein Angca_001283, partial [Angiostrongylus cantonensis]